MNNITNFAQANKELLKFVPPFRANQKYTLDKMTALMKYLGNPQELLKIVHVAGTSGKTSTCYYISALLKVAGFKVGLTVSPHIDEVNERVQIDGVPIAEIEFCRYLSEFIDLIDGFDQKPSYFEVLIAFMYWVFAKLQVDYAVVEVGLGGLLDGTNVATSDNKICVITDIGFDHIQVLGKTLPEIARQKAGIIYQKNTVFCLDQSDEVMKVIREVCTQKNAKLNVMHPDLKNTPDVLSLFQKRNWFLANETVRDILAKSGKPALSKELLNSSAQTIVPARMEVFQVGDKKVIIDGSHNEQKISTLLKSVKNKFPNTPMATLVSFGQNKSTSLNSSLKMLEEMSTNIIATKFTLGQDEIRRPVKPQEIVEICKSQGYQNVKTITEPEQAFRDLLARPEDLLLVTGSFYLLNHIRPLILKK